MKWQWIKWRCQIGNENVFAAKKSWEKNLNFEKKETENIEKKQKQNISMHDKTICCRKNRKKGQIVDMKLK